MVAVGDPVILARMPGFRVATTTVTADTSTFTSSETQVASVTASLIDGVLYRVVFDGGFQADATGVQIHCNVREDNTSGNILGQRRTYDGATAAVTANRVEGQYTATSTGNKTFVATARRTSGTANINLDAGGAFPSRLYVEVIG